MQINKVNYITKQNKVDIIKLDIQNMKQSYNIQKNRTYSDPPITIP